MAQGQGRSSKQGVKLLYIRDYLYTYTNKEHPKNANHIVEYLASKGIDATPKTIYNDILRLQIDFSVPVEYNPAGRKILCKRFSTKSRMALESRADSGLNPLITESHGGQNGMRAGTA